MSNDFTTEYFDSDKDEVIMAFATSDHRNTGFQWRRSLTALGKSCVLFRDQRKLWYQQGCVGIGARSAVVDYVASFVNLGIDVTTIGVSSGAYAALYFGQLAKVKRCIVISPASGNGKPQDFPEKFAHLLQPSHDDPNIDDLRKYFPDGPVMKTTAYISDHQHEEMDFYMALRIGIPDIRVIKGYEHHTLAEGMRDRGLFPDMFSENGVWFEGMNNLGKGYVPGSKTW